MRFQPRFSLSVLAVALAAVGFLAIHQYNPKGDLVWNIMQGEILLTDACPAPSSDPWDNIGRDLVNSNCGLTLKYKWLLIGSIALGAAALIWPCPTS